MYIHIYIYIDHEDHDVVENKADPRGETARFLYGGKCKCGEGKSNIH